MGAIEVQAIISDMARAAWSLLSKVAHHGARQHHAAAGRQALQEAQQRSRWPASAAKAQPTLASDIDDEAAQDDRPPAEPVARRAIEDLADAEGDHERRQSELDIAGACHCRSTAITGRAGRYMSIDSGVKADNSASTATQKGRQGGAAGRWPCRKEICGGFRSCIVCGGSNRQLAPDAML